jgi:hypothetical protein
VNGVTRRPAFWIAYALLAAFALAVAWQLFPLAIPLVNLDITLARHDAVAAAEARAAKLRLAPPGARSAARFEHDQTLQNSVELEGGGKPAFAALVAGRAYSPYWWEVRLFAPGEVTEALIRFRPDGGVYGFAQKLPETWVPADPARLALDAEAARRLAEERARADWDVDFGPYALQEQVQQKRTSGRVDHGFVYERSADAIAGARLRLRLTVTGDALTEVTYFSQVPEAFERRYQELRSANNTIAGTASLAAGLLYGLGGCVLGVLWLLRRHWLLWRPALAAGFVVSSLVGAMLLAATPTAWFGFDTAQSVTTFWTRQVGAAVLATLGGGLAYALIFMAAESLSRRAFGGHPQLWRVWSRAAAPTRQVLGRTVGGYLFVPIELALVAVFYYATNRWLGWWQPSEALTDPNILGSAVPALAPIAMSLQAGFMEECVFRAVPLSLAAIVGAHFGRRGLALALAVVLQALIFGGAHANYPGFPPYSRLVELIVPSMLWALIFLRFGLVPTIILHALFDLTLFAIPIFLVDAPGGNLQRALVIAAGLVPIAVVAARRMTAGAWRELAPSLRNGAWQPAARADAVAAPAAAAHARARGWIAAFQRSLPVLGLAGLAAWVAFTPFRADVPPLPQDRAQAIAAADAALRSRGIVPGPEWRRAAAPKLSIDEAGQRPWHRFVWGVAGPETYRRLVGGTLAPPVWEVRYARFEGDVAERAEEWDVTINGDGSTRVVRHTLPEARAGASLARDAARAIAERELRDRYGLDPAALKEVAADEKQRPARTDWSFTFADPRIDVGEGGEARVLVNVAGDEIASSGRFVHVPESWQRAERDREGRLLVLKLLLGGLFALAALAAVVMAVLEWTKGHVDRRALVGTVGILFTASALAVVNRWPLIAMNLNTAEPVLPQVSIAVLGMLLGGVLMALVSGLLAGVGVWAARQRPATPLAVSWAPWMAGIAAMLFVAGASAVLGSLAPRRMPLWPGYGTAASWWPPLAAMLEAVQVLASAGIAIYALHWLGRITADYARRRWLAVAVVALALASGALSHGQDAATAAAVGLVEGGLIFLCVHALLRFDVRAVPAFVATAAVLGAIETAALLATPAAFALAALAIAAMVAAACAATRYLAFPAAVTSASPTAG